VDELSPVGPIPVADLLVAERQLLLDLLAGLGPGEWDRPTECPAWSVTGIVLHLLGDDLSILSRQRDGRSSPVALAAAAQGWDQLFTLLDRHNEAWVEAANSLGVSTALVCDLLRLTGDWTHHWYTTVDPERLGEPVPWAGPEPAPYWFLAAREYLERWIHHQQIRRAIGTPPLDEARWVIPAVATAVRGFPAGLSLLPAKADTTISIVLPNAAWTVRKDPEQWNLYDGAATDATARMSLGLDDAALIFSRALSSAELARRISIDGDQTLGATVVAGLSAFFGAG